ncbi:MAG: DnaJ domain-containing protein [Alphaproteobacteria bacterium]|nr:DnaJ domain-containing protein [Alphaproteobacteria bacterium]MBV8336195.1 DnaJ domain-containing protein [Alphaproteobacteria bacterium]
MIYLLGGFAILTGFLMLVYLFVNADPARLARGLKVTGIIIAVIAVATLAISGRLAALLMPVAMLMPLLIRVRSVLDRFRPPTGGQTSTVATPFLRMTLDHDTGSMTGTILRGRFSGMRVEELGSAELLALLRECRAEDEEGARLLEAYLDRLHPNWREELAGERASGSTGGARPAGADMTVEEAYAILGLAPGADPEAIKEAHRRLMIKLHPDHGGSDYLATKINRARDVLLHR